MALQTYNDLTSAVADWLNRPDLTNRIPDFITLAEAEMRRRLREEVVSGNMTLDAAVVALPVDVQDVRSIRLDTGDPITDIRLQPRTAEELMDLRRRLTPAGKPRYFARVGDDLWLTPEPDASYDAVTVYVKAFTPMSATDSTTWTLFQRAPDLYLYGALMAAAAYLEHDERVPLWRAGFETAIAQLNAERENKEAELQMRPTRLPRVF